MMVNKKHNKLAFKFLLSVAYFSLFAVQFTGKFYSIANFFVYSVSGEQHALVTNQSGSIPREDQSFVHTKSLPDGRHLSLDKRYHAKDPIVASFVQIKLAPLYKELRRTFYTTSSFGVSANLINASLRGPPTA